MLEEIRNFIRQIISQETLDAILVHLEKAKEVIVYLIAQLTELRDWIFSFIGR